MSLEFHIGTWAELGDAAYAIRYEVFVCEQGVPLEMERDEADETSIHALALKDGVPVATGRLLADGHIGRIAVVKAWRGAGVGRQLTQGLIEEARKRGFTEVVLHAQTSAEGFYNKLGFLPQGAVFMEAGIPHQQMALSLRSKPA